MTENTIMTNMLMEFFDKQISDGLQSRFINALSDDFDLIMKDFNDFIINKNLKLDSDINKINLHDVAKLIIDEICAFKIQAIKYQHKMITESANRAKEMAMRSKGELH